MHTPKVAVVYLTYFRKDSESDIRACFETLQKVNYPREAWKIIMVENPSPNGASKPFIERDWMPKAGVTLPAMEHHSNVKDLGYAGANNVAIDSAKAWGADYLFLLNQDTVVHPDFLKEAVEYAATHPKAAAVQSRLMLGQETDKLNTRGNALHFLGYGYCLGEGQTMEEAARDRSPMFFASGGAILVSMKAVERVGLFDPDYYLYHEDVDFSWRARLAGYEIGYAERSVVYHHYEFNRSMKKFYWMERNRHITHLSNLKWGTYLLMLPLMVVVELGMIPLNFRAGWGVLKLKSYLPLFKLSTWRWILRRRAWIKRLRKVRDADLLALMVPTVVARDPQLQNPIVRYIANPIMSVYFWGLKKVVKW